MDRIKEERGFSLITSRECRFYAVLIGVIALTLSVYGALSNSEDYPRLYLALICGWILIWPMARIAGFFMNVRIISNIQEYRSRTIADIEKLKKSRKGRMIPNTQYIIPRQELMEMLRDEVNIDINELLRQRDTAQKVILVWTYIYCALIPVVVISSYFVWRL